MESVGHKVEALTYDREKRVYKDAYVDNFRRVRHFPALAAIGTGRSDGDSIILVQDTGHDDVSAARAAQRAHSKLDNVPSRLMPTNPVDDMFSSTPPLTCFRTAVMCKHTNARKENAAKAMPDGGLRANPADNSSGPTSTGYTPRYNVDVAPIFKPSSATDAKAAIERKASYNNEAYRDRPIVGREMSSPHGKAEWAYNNPMVAREEVRTRTYFNVPPEGVIRADRRYTEAFIQQHVDAYQLSRRAKQC